MFAYFTEKKVLCCKSLNVHAQIMQSCRKATKSDHLAPFCLSGVVSEGSSVFVLSADERSQLKLSHFIQSGSSNLQRPLVTSHTPTNTAGTQLSDLLLPTESDVTSQTPQHLTGKHELTWRVDR